MSRDGRDGGVEAIRALLPQEEPAAAGSAITPVNTRDTASTPDGVKRKIPPELRKKKFIYLRERSPVRRAILRLRDDSQALRSTVQFAFILLTLWIGVEFYLFIHWGMSGGETAFVPRPPGAEGFLPISALISLKYWFQTGIINAIHPAALFILIAVLAVSLAAKKAFCSWLCPIGTLSESLGAVGHKLFGRNVTLPRWLDYPLRSLKYLLLLFFVCSIWNMDVESLAAFIGSPYNKVADIKMYLFFAQISTTALAVIGSLIGLSLLIRNFWCRFLCPYGALLGIVSWLSPLKITRTKATCIDCELCTKVCPANIQVHTANRVWSDECTGCLACVQACPVKDTLEMRLRPSGARVPGWVFGSLVAGVFVAVTGLAMLLGHWQSSIPNQEYLRRFQQLD